MPGKSYAWKTPLGKSRSRETEVKSQEAGRVAHRLTVRTRCSVVRRYRRFILKLAFPLIARRRDWNSDSSLLSSDSSLLSSDSFLLTYSLRSRGFEFNLTTLN